MTIDSPWITTYSGKQFFIMRATVDDICIEDIAHGLSNICRYVGQCQPFYSVAEHSCRMVELVKWAKNWEDADELNNALLLALLHDAAEAYIGDISSGLKHLFPELMGVEDRILCVILNKYHVLTDPLIKELDVQIRVTEVMNLLPNGHAGWNFAEPEHFEVIHPWLPAEAESMFLGMYNDLHKEK